jgi:hypothetical protein
MQLRFALLAFVSLFALPSFASQYVYECRMARVPHDRLGTEQTLKVPIEQGSHGGTEYSVTLGQDTVKFQVTTTWFIVGWERGGRVISQVITAMSGISENRVVLLMDPTNLSDQVHASCDLVETTKP